MILEIQNNSNLKRMSGGDWLPELGLTLHGFVGWLAGELITFFGAIKVAKLKIALASTNNQFN
jgi:hypothetical protein